MGFNIGRFIGSIAPFVGSIFGPVGTAVGIGVSAGLRQDQPTAAATVGRATQPGPVSAQFIAPAAQVPAFGSSSIAPVPARFSLSPRVGPVIGGAIGGLIPSFFGNGDTGGGKSPISAILAKARAATGGPVTRNKIIDAAKVCGLEIAADTFGLDVREVCMVVVKGRTRRRRGVSAADVRRTKRTIHFASKIRKDLKALAK